MEIEDSIALTCLLRNGGDPGITDSYPLAPLHVAASQNGYNAAEVILRESLPSRAKDLINQSNMLGRSSLHDAASFGRSSILKLLLDAGADLDKRDYRGFTPLHLACMQSNTTIVAMLVAAGADTNPGREGFYSYAYCVALRYYRCHACVIQLI